MDFEFKLAGVKERFGHLLRRENLLIAGALVMTIVVTFWIFSNSAPQNQGSGDENSDIGTVIPPGQLIVPLELANAAALSALVNKNAVVDVFKAGESNPLVEGLRIIKLNAGDGPLFGALVPENIAGSLQTVFSNPKLRAAIRATKSSPTRFHVSRSSKPTLVEISVGD